jgi:putative Mg2+ transporter-C (MgtC) family protein
MTSGRLGLIEPPVSDLDVALRIAAALVLGGIIGLEREVRQQPAGLRTHIAVALGAALFGVVSVHGFDAYVQDRAASNYQVDVTRVASQVVVGIGFLGGGTILKHGASIRGLTTAASLWVTAAVGLAAGVGSLVAAAITTGALLLSLTGLRVPRRFIRDRLSRGRRTVLIQLGPGADPKGAVEQILALPDVTVRRISLRNGETGKIIEVDLGGPSRIDVSTLFAAIADRADVADVDIA